MSIATLETKNWSFNLPENLMRFAPNFLEDCPYDLNWFPSLQHFEIQLRVLFQVNNILLPFLNQFLREICWGGNREKFSLCFLLHQSRWTWDLILHALLDLWWVCRSGTCNRFILTWRWMVCIWQKFCHKNSTSDKFPSSYLWQFLLARRKS